MNKSSRLVPHQQEHIYVLSIDIAIKHWTEFTVRVVDGYKDDRLEVLCFPQRLFYESLSKTVDVDDIFV